MDDAVAVPDSKTLLRGPVSMVKAESVMMRTVKIIDRGREHV